MPPLGHAAHTQAGPGAHPTAAKSHILSNGCHSPTAAVLLLVASPAPNPSLSISSPLIPKQLVSFPTGCRVTLSIFVQRFGCLGAGWEQDIDLKDYWSVCHLLPKFLIVCSNLPSQAWNLASQAIPPRLSYFFVYFFVLPHFCFIFGSEIRKTAPSMAFMDLC